MTRRMKANAEYPGTGHAAEHYWNEGCPRGSAPCEPAAARRMQANAQYSSHSHSHGKEHDETNGCAVGVPCQPVTDPDIATVAVPVTGTVLVIDGVVQDVKPEDASVREYLVSGTSGPGTHYGFYVRKPKPSFFEPHKTYRRSASDYQAHRFDCVRIDRDSSGNPIAYGQLYYQTWTTWNTLSCFDDTWKEEA